MAKPSLTTTLTHYINPLTVYCALCNIADKKSALRVAKGYEKCIYPVLKSLCEVIYPIEKSLRNYIGIDQEEIF